MKRQNVLDAQTSRNNVRKDEAFVDAEGVVESDVDGDDEAFVSELFACVVEVDEFWSTDVSKLSFKTHQENNTLRNNWRVPILH